MADSDPQLSSQPSSDSSETSSSDERSISSFEVTKKGPKLLSSGPDRFLRQLDEIHRKLKADLDKENVAQKVYCPALADAKVAVGHIRGYLDSYVLTPSPAMMSPESTPKTVEVFATGELVENILRFLEPVDLLVAAQVNHVTSKAIANSQTLQEILHLQPSGKGHISTIFSREESPFDNFAIIFKEISLGVVDSEDMPPLLHLNGTVVDDDTQPEPQRAIKYAVVISTQYQRPYFHKPGPITRRMLICQPPLTFMQYWPSCCHGSPQVNPDAAGTMPPTTIRRIKELKSDTGITVGDVYNAAMDMMKRHRRCPYAAAGLHDSHGVVRPHISFEARISLKRDDPYILRRMVQKSGTEWEANEVKHGKQQLGLYISRKQLAHRHGLRIPSYAEFLNEDKARPKRSVCLVEEEEDE